ncbi:MAG TPA: hypothetical protein VHM65_08600 [Candidatus Lustribacter sp.]|nr:hypothetical protein [Candidatus Lustribacter sp.]
MSAHVLPVLIHAEEKAFELPMPAIAYGLSIFGAFLLLLLILWFFRNTASKLQRRDPGTGAHH